MILLLSSTEDIREHIKGNDKLLTIKKFVEKYIKFKNDEKQFPIDEIIVNWQI